MTFTFSRAYRAKLDTCHPMLIAIVEKVLELRPLVVVCGHRNEVAQKLACATGNSSAPFPTSRHNSFPSEAVDVAPLVDGVIPWNDIHAFNELAGDMKVAGGQLGCRIEWGGDWTGKMKGDVGHFQLPKGTV